MRNYVIASYLLSVVLLIIAVGARSVLTISDDTNSTFWPSSDSSHLQMEARSNYDDVSKNIPPQTISEISLNVESSLKVKTDGRPGSPSDPIIFPRNNIQSRNKGEIVSLSAATKDSYLDALDYSHTMKEDVKQDYVPRPVYRAEDTHNNNSNSSSGSSNNPHAPETESKISRISYSGNTYDVPAKSYIVPSIDLSYEEPHQVPYGTEFNYDSYGAYGLPNNKYKVTNVHSYGPPSYSSSSGHPYLAYGTSQQGLGSLQATYSTSHPLPDFFPFTFLPAIDFSWPISLKIDAFTLIKIVLKLIVFKIIVKFIAVICLLIFIPKLIHKKHAVDDISRKFMEQPNFPTEQLHLLESLVTRSIEHYKNMNRNDTNSNAPCKDAACRIKRSKLLMSNDTWSDYARLFKAYVAEEEAVQRQSGGNRRRRR
ncbi:PREDICTED: uncharacterized protein LOC105361833 [Ceratosolen solmsi marchali]|uniref:Uncharacterized protein LOC105361833 n=1 Tax=Ceratosolen solmsi marchali TaxID=326594 RepID=A0AAJ7DV05_9HYME|nr:PREDICTED: uncharacterized protein LOC105361833 [Ceratosolen solmsi marchali]